jgi:hypothetical protein
MNNKIQPLQRMVPASTDHQVVAALPASHSCLTASFQIVYAIRVMFEYMDGSRLPIETARLVLPAYQKAKHFQGDHRTLHGLESFTKILTNPEDMDGELPLVEAEASC